MKKNQKSSSSGALSAEDILGIGFCDFCTLCQVSLTPGQETIARVLFDYQQPKDLPEPFRSLAKQIFGPIDEVPKLAQAVATIVAGGRGGKTYLFALRLLHLCYTVPLDTLAPGEEAFATIVAPDKKLAKQSLNYALGALRKAGLSKTLAAKPATESFTIRRGAQRVVYSIFAASAGGLSGRGRSLVGSAIDEAAFLGDDSYAISDVDIYKATSARVMDGGQFLVGSTPWAEDGLIYDFWLNNWGKPVFTTVAHAPTKLMRNSGSKADLRVLEEIAREELRDPANAKREFGALFLASGSDLYFAASAVDAAMVPVPKQIEYGDMVSVGGDLGFTTDASSEVVVVTDRQGILWIMEAIELLPAPGMPLIPSEVGAAFRSLASKYGADCVVADAVYRESLREWLGSIAVVPAPAGNEGKVQSYDKLKRAFVEKKIRVSANLDAGLRQRLSTQLKQVTSSAMPAGGMRITSPRRKGHGDIVSALVCAVSRAPWKEAPAPKPALTAAELEEIWLREHHIGEYAQPQRDWWQSGDATPDWAMQ